MERITNKLKVILIVFTAAILSLVWLVADEQQQLNKNQAIVSKNIKKVEALEDSLGYFENLKKNRNFRKWDTVSVKVLILRNRKGNNELK